MAGELLSTYSEQVRWRCSEPLFSSIEMFPFRCFFRMFQNPTSRSFHPALVSLHKLPPRIYDPFVSIPQFCFVPLTLSGERLFRASIFELEQRSSRAVQLRRSSSFRFSFEFLTFLPPNLHLVCPFFLHNSVFLFFSRPVLFYSSILLFRLSLCYLFYQIDFRFLQFSCNLLLKGLLPVYV